MKITDKLKIAVKAFNQSPNLSTSGATVLRNYAKQASFEPERQLKGITYKAIEKISIAISVYEPYVVKKDGNKLDNHPFYNLFDNPNERQNASDFLGLWSFYYEIYGETFIYLAKGENSNKVKEMYLLNPAQVELIVYEGELQGYKLHKNNGQQVPLIVDEIIHDKRPNPFNEWRGMSVMERASTYIDTEITTSVFTLNYMRNNASPSGIVTLPNMEKETFKQFAQQWREGYEGPENAGKTAFVRGEGVDFKAVGATLKDVDQEITRKMSKEDVLMMFDVPKGLLGVADSKGLGTNDIEPLEYIFAKYNTEPRMKRLDRIFKKVAMMTPQFNQELKIHHETPVPDDKRFKLEQNTAGVNVWLTVNEVREMQGLEPLAGYDEIKVKEPIATITTGKQKKVTLKKEQEPDPEQFRQQLEENSDIYAVKIEREIAKFVRKQEHNVISKIEASNKSFEDWLFTLKTESEAMAQAINPILIELIEEMGKDTVNWITGDKFTITQEMRATTSANILKVSGVFNEETLRALEATIAEGVGKNESLVKIKKRVEATYKDAKGYRAKRIAQTESMRTSNLTVEDVYRQNGFTGKEWFANPGACEFCEILAGESRSLGQSFSELGSTIQGKDGGVLEISYDTIAVPPVHPNCKCSIKAITGF